MQELRLVAVSEDGTYAVLAVPGRGGRFSLPIDDRLRTVARGQFSRLAQYEIEVENPLRPKEIQDRIRAGETAEEIADVAGIPIDRVRRFEGPVLAEREFRAQEAQRATVRGHTESGPGPRLGEIVGDRLAEAGSPTDSQAWDSRKRPDGNWQVQLQFAAEGRGHLAEWVFDPRRRQVIPADDLARQLCLPQVDWPAARVASLGSGSATVTPIGSRHSAQHGDQRPDTDRLAAPGLHAAPGRPLAASPQQFRQSPDVPWQPAIGPDTVPSRAQEPPRLGAGQRPAEAQRSLDAERPDEAPRAAETRREDDAQHAGDAQHAPDAGRDSAVTAPDTAAPAPDQAAAEQSAPAQSAPAPVAPERPAAQPAATTQPATGAAATAAGEAAAQDGEQPQEPAPTGRQGRKNARGRRSSVPSWDEIMLGTSRAPE